jgi:hypothetical protein
MIFSIASKNDLDDQNLLLATVGISIEQMTFQSTFGAKKSILEIANNV